MERAYRLNEVFVHNFNGVELLGLDVHGSVDRPVGPSAHLFKELVVGDALQAVSRRVSWCQTLIHLFWLLNSLWGQNFIALGLALGLRQLFLKDKLVFKWRVARVRVFFVWVGLNWVFIMRRRLLYIIRKGWNTVLFRPEVSFEMALSFSGLLCNVVPPSVEARSMLPTGD
jgi:hypothetical protein